MWNQKHLQELNKSGKIRGFSGSPVNLKTKSKYGNKKVVFDGMEFDSKKEAARYYDLKLMALSGEIKNLRRQVEYKLSVCKYFADLVYERNGIEVVEDVKSSYTRKLAPYRMKKKLMKAELGIEISEV